MLMVPARALAGPPEQGASRKCTRRAASGSASACAAAGWIVLLMITTLPGASVSMAPSRPSYDVPGLVGIDHQRDHEPACPRHFRRRAGDHGAGCTRLALGLRSHVPHERGESALEQPLRDLHAHRAHTDHAYVRFCLHAFLA